MKAEIKGILFTILFFPITLLLTIVSLVLTLPTIGLTGLIGGDEEWMTAPIIISWYILSSPYYFTISEIEGEELNKIIKENLEKYSNIEKTHIGNIYCFPNRDYSDRIIRKAFKEQPLKLPRANTFLSSEKSDIGVYLENGIIYCNENTSTSNRYSCLLTLLETDLSKYNIETDKIYVRDIRFKKSKEDFE